MSVSKAQIRATEKYKKANYWRPSLCFPKAWEPIIREQCETDGVSINSFISSIVEAELKKRNKE